MPGEGGCIAQDDEFHAGTGHGYIHSAQVGQEANLSFVVASDKTYHDDVTLLSLKAIDGVDRDEMVERLEERCATDKLAQVLDLSFVG